MLFKYARFGGIIDWFEHTLDKEAILENLRSQTWLGPEEIESQVIKKGEDIDEAVKQMIQTMVTEEDEEPHTVRFFSVPNFDYQDFYLFGVAKISNNGSTYIFGNNKELLEQFAPDGFDTISLG